MVIIKSLEVKFHKGLQRSTKEFNPCSSHFDFPFFDYRVFGPVREIFLRSLSELMHNVCSEHYLHATLCNSLNEVQSVPGKYNAFCAGVSK